MFKYSVERPADLARSGVLPLAIAIALLNGCATTKKDADSEKGLEASDYIATTMDESRTENPVDAKAETSEKDPFEGFNRTMFGFNQKLDTYIAKPITSAYKWLTPEFVQTGIANFYTNTKTINVVLNDVLQGKLTQSASDTGRFLVNTTVGLAGLFDVAKHIGLEQHEEDFDQTLAVWGVPQGYYLVLPILGPTTSRGIPGSVVDTAANPVNYVGWPVQALGVLNERANAEGALKFIDEAALDPYVFTRESFLQWRDYLATDGKAKEGAVADEFENELEENLGEEANSSIPVSDTKAAQGASNLTNAATQKTEESANIAKNASTAIAPTLTAEQTNDKKTTANITAAPAELTRQNSSDNVSTAKTNNEAKSQPSTRW